MPPATKARKSAAPARTLLNNIDLVGTDLPPIRGWVNANIALEWLATQVRNRATVKSVIAAYADDMIEGRWTFNGEPIKFDCNGRLIDGQQRLYALLETVSAEHPDGAMIEVLVVRSLPPESQDSMDQGRRRQAGAQLELSGIRNSMYIAAIIRMLRLYETGSLMGDTSRRSRMTNTAILAYYNDPAHHDELERVSDMHTSIYKIKGAVPAVSGAMYVLFSRAGIQGANEFFASLVSGANLAGDSPILALRNRLAQHTEKGKRLTHRETMYLYIKAWNAWTNGHGMFRLTRPAPGSMRPQHFNITGLAPYSGFDQESNADLG